MIGTGSDAVTLRPSVPEDRLFLRAVYASTRQQELAPLPWPEAAKSAFLAEQFDLQDRAYRSTYRDARFLIVERCGRPIGRLYLADLSAAELRIIDVALLPDHRGQGIGRGLVGAVLAEADRRGLAVTLHVERWNPAWHLYQGLGFAAVADADAGVYVLLRREPVRVVATVS